MIIFWITVKALTIFIIMAMLIASAATVAGRRINGQSITLGQFSLGRMLRLYLTQPTANFIKLLFKENSSPSYAISDIYKAAPYLSVAAVLMILGVIPFGDEADLGGTIVKLRVAAFDSSVPAMLILLVPAFYGPILAGYSSDSKPGLIGSIASLGNLVSHFVTLCVAVLGILAVFGSAALHEIAAMQSGPITAWGIIYQPLGFILFTLSALLLGHDMPNGSAGGWNRIADWRVEYTGLRLAMISAPGSLLNVIVSMLAVTLYFGSCHIPWLEWSKLSSLLGTGTSGGIILMLMQISVFVIKTYLLCLLMLYMRTLIPRLRGQDGMLLGWKVLLPVALANLALTAVIISLIK